MILHITFRALWPAVEITPLDGDEFVHCSDPGTVHLPANRLFAGRTDLLLLEVDPARLGVPLRWEPGDPPIPGGPWFPHVYGPIPAAAVVEAHDFQPGPDGTFELPAALAQR
ncbi:DUF952 domain-containing protein [Actinokineospora globicatena]|uniref:DUF952 domain-containing protein n=1 Tax=Actinokineospora globicatena TaxID=103729 RepID=UPI0024A42289|nr:Uncharacterized conserved protein, DUF952 family [Actinokineospora globicatena]GLW77186.1 hypothetical protein Aglo01_16680 [Actinokineospora globicatena]GLW84020.1 hypothetical protein Aglo02_16600 [Actinokineospora globicatena]